MGHAQRSLFKKTALNHGGELRKRRNGRSYRPLSGRDPLHLVFKINKHKLKRSSLRSPKSFPLVLFLVQRWARYFKIRVEQVSVQHDHVHMLVRAYRRKDFIGFFRVLLGQIAQTFEKEGMLKNVTDTPAARTKSDATMKKKGTGLWKYRVFSRVV